MSEDENLDIETTGIKRDNDFICKKYKNTPYHLVELITSIDNKGYIKTQEERSSE